MWLWEGALRHRQRGAIRGAWAGAWALPLPCLQGWVGKGPLSHLELQPGVRAPSQVATWEMRGKEGPSCLGGRRGARAASASPRPPSSLGLPLPSRSQALPSSGTIA